LFDQELFLRPDRFIESATGAVAVKEREATAARGAAGVLDGSEHGAKLVRLGRSFMLLP